MDELIFEILDVNNKENLIKYEELLFDAFINRSPQGWVHNNYKRIDNCRLQPIFTYQDLLILTVKRDEKLIISNTLNLNTKDKMQLEYIGFNRNKINENEKYCEGLVFCTAPDAVNPNFVDDFKKVNIFFNNEYINRGFQAIYGTCDARLLRFYTRIGFEKIDEISDIGKEYLLKMKVK